jgi:hypothetical protein
MIGIDPCLTYGQLTCGELKKAERVKACTRDHVHS